MNIKHLEQGSVSAGQEVLDCIGLVQKMPHLWRSCQLGFNAQEHSKLIWRGLLHSTRELYEVQWKYLSQVMRCLSTASLQIVSRIFPPCMKAAQFSKESSGQQCPLINTKELPAVCKTGMVCFRDKLIILLNVQDPH